MSTDLPEQPSASDSPAPAEGDGSESTAPEKPDNSAPVGNNDEQIDKPATNESDVQTKGIQAYLEAYKRLPTSQKIFGFVFIALLLFIAYVISKVIENSNLDNFQTTLTIIVSVMAVLIVTIFGLWVFRQKGKNIADTLSGTLTVLVETEDGQPVKEAMVMVFPDETHAISNVNGVARPPYSFDTKEQKLEIRVSANDYKQLKTLTITHPVKAQYTVVMKYEKIELTEEPFQFSVSNGKDGLHGATIILTSMHDTPDAVTNKRGIANFYIELQEETSYKVRYLDYKEISKKLSKSEFDARLVTVSLKPKAHPALMIEVTRGGEPIQGADVTLETNQPETKTTNDKGIVNFYLQGPLQAFTSGFVRFEGRQEAFKVDAPKIRNGRTTTIELKRLPYRLFALLGLLVVIGVASAVMLFLSFGKLNPRQVVDNYWDLVTSHQYEAAWNWLTLDFRIDRHSNSLPNYINGYENWDPHPLCSADASNLELREEAGNIATVFGVVTYSAGESCSQTPVVFEFVLRRENGVWKIDDLNRQ